MDKGLLDRFYKGQCSEEEVQAVLRWFRYSKVESEHEQELHALWDEAGKVKVEEEHKHDAGRIFSKIKAKLHEPTQPEQELPGEATSVEHKHPMLWLKIAAAVLLPVCLVWALVQHASQSATSTAYVSVEARPGFKKTINLSDGSVIMLNAGSRVSFPEKFAADKREILLEGEAFFKVAKDSLRPFIVHTGTISTQALGTSFNINYSSCDEPITVALATGSVRIDREERGQKRQLTKLVPGQQLSYSRGSQQYTVGDFDGNEVLGWQQGLLYFKNADMNQIVKKLENWYGVKIEVKGAGKQEQEWNYTGEYDNESLEVVLEGIAFVKDFSYKRSGNNVKIVFN